MANRLQLEDSPYLQQHKNNPVDWYPWCDEAFLKAKVENKAIFISIGYSSCHWCHVMEENVFENKECADILNKSFICIKVDKEERPDIDKHYQEVYILLNRRAGGWPTSIFCTPENKPFFAGTYIPPESREGSIEGMGFIELTKLIADKISSHDEQLLKNADEIESFLNHKEHPKEATVLKEDFSKNFMLQVKSNYDTLHGGFSSSPKFPQVSTLGTLLVIDKLYDDKAAKAMVLNTLQNMKKGGMYDLIEGGFCRYSVDEEWLVPHFEKMLYDNALLCELYTNAYLTYQDDSFLHVAKEIADFWHNHMSQDDLMYSASDADSEGEEGTYFIYSYDEVYKLLSDNGYENIEDILEKLSISEDGNFEDKNIIRFKNTPPKEFEDIKFLLRGLRASREYPFIDKKIQTSWSSMMIKALFVLGNIDDSYKQKAIKNLDALLKSMFIEGKLYHSTLIHKTPKVEAFLEDYAFLAQALIEAFNSTQDELYLIRAQNFANSALEKFYDKGTWKFSIGEFETKAEISDNTYTSSVSIMIDVLISLSTLLEDEKYAHFAFKTLEYNSYELARRPVIYPYMLRQVLRYLKGDRVVKSNTKNLTSNAFELASLKYPFIQKKAHESEDYMICGDKSCFANTKSINKIDDIISNTF
ncbi:MAG: thymidylate kinase [Sulfurimonas sp. RIFOXYD12_FULL_33_39]|uniref:thioredoxin domain-containing protein n=1 Tax=unclassified Sulfurimonas TaxID=2623549 RepID=UPI0008AB2438|nr:MULTISPECIES: thioredoxin domain-containing protein [unclassified Sulfurimonas]OHE07384.1 MAG: thymidylate kinase [Sulfurimonas sp. RIFCSPLOWO2_12_FULL_34_6]OHE08846.1 MAG: thymidylate kinase [Sulfurimonas sp. RIFOXYD12_FULL_33_39]OHE14156.1 MAG: thymidylate kinase [Sulfurimonas sp. RIFOXYD2_FULL_34_21]DAB28021.1 MAG TPA: thioredoxin domain-containing protein [Sulfurimonas sp. UBA10385]